MTALSVPAVPPVEPIPLATVFGRSVAAEWTKLWTVRSTWWSFAAATSMLLFVAIAFGLDVDGVTPVWVAAEMGILFAQFGLLIPAMLAVTSEYSSGAMRTTLQGVPRRGVLAASRLVVTVGTTTLMAAVLALVAAIAAGIALGSDAEVVASDVAGSVGAITLIVASGTVITVGLATALRSAAGTLATVFLGLLVLPVMLPNLGVGWLATIGTNLPGAATLSLLEAIQPRLVSGGHGAAVLVAWMAVTVAAGAWSLAGRDAV